MKATYELLEQIKKQREERLSKYKPVDSEEEKLKRTQGMKTFGEWQLEFIDEFFILDADGFDRNDPYFSQRLYTKDDFRKRSCRCTCKWNKKFLKEMKEILEKE
jgi:hypothetical protein